MWNLGRAERLARSLSLTLSEISSIVAYPHPDFLRQIQKGKLNGPACVLLTLIEHAYLNDLVHDTVDLFNFHGRPEDIKGDGVHASTPA